MDHCILQVNSSDLRFYQKAAASCGLTLTTFTHPFPNLDGDLVEVDTQNGYIGIDIEYPYTDDGLSAFWEKAEQLQASA